MAEQEASGYSERISALLEDGIALARQGRHAEARTIFRQVVQRAPEQEDGWLWLAWLAENQEQSLEYLHEGLRFSPHSARLREALGWVEAHKPAQTSQTAPTQEPHVVTDAPGKAARGGKRRPVRQRAVSRHRLTQKRLLSLSALSIKWPHIAFRMPQVNLKAWGAWLRNLGITAVSIGGILLLGLLALAVLARNASTRAPVVTAMVLPTPILDATPTPSIEQRTRPLWAKVDLAWVQEDWDTAIYALEQIRSFDPRNDAARKRLSEALYYRARRSIDANELEAAKRDLDRAIRLDASNRDLQSARQDVELYRDAVRAYLEQDWGRAVYLLNEVFKRTPDFRDTRTMLGQAHCNLAKQLLEEEKLLDVEQGQAKLEEALAQAKRCEEILEGDPEASAVVQSVQEAIRPPKRIEVSLSQYRAKVYENNEVIKTFTICVGRPSHPTKTGRYKIQSKMPMAYASTWDLEMPYWLGIYWAGGTENGFHALPILSNGQVLWRGALGTGCSFGCIVLDTPDAKWLYDWAEIGTVVLIER